MPYVQRNHRQKITGLYANRQPGYAEEELPEDHPDVFAFLAKHPVPEEMLKPLTERELQRITEDHNRLRKEHAAIKEAIWAFNSNFDELELALCGLVSACLRLSARNGSHLAQAIYFTPDGFRARTILVNNIVTQLVREKPALARLTPLWSALYDQFKEVRENRNVIALGFPKTYQIGSRRPIARLTPPSFDVLNVGRKVEDGQTFGLGASEIIQGARKASWLRDRLDEVNRLVADAYSRAPLRRRYDELEAGLRLSRN